MPATGARRRMPKRTREQTRALMLAAAVELVRERVLAGGEDAVSAALAHVRLTQVAERASALALADAAGPAPVPITTGAIYQLWPRQADFQIDLLFHIADLQARTVPGLPEDGARFRRAAQAGVPLDATVAGLVEDVLRHYCQDPIFRVELSFLLGAADPRVRRALAHRQQTFFGGADQAWQSLLDAYRRRPRPPFSVRDVTVAAAAQITGSVVMWWADPHSVRDPAGLPDRTLCSHAVNAVLDRLTEPAD